METGTTDGAASGKRSKGNLLHLSRVAKEEEPLKQGPKTEFKGKEILEKESRAVKKEKIFMKKEKQNIDK